MSKADDKLSPNSTGRAGEKFRKRPFRPEINEESQNVSHEAGKNVSCLSTHQCWSCVGISVTAGISELEQIFKQMTFTRSEAQHFISLMHSRTIEEDSPTPFLSLEASTSGSIKKHKHGDKRDNFHASVVGSRVVEEEIAPPAEVANAYKVSNICRQDSKLNNTNATSTCLSITLVASQQQPATIENLPEELLTNIFIRLLAKQLAQMRSVSKYWNALLSQPSFIKSHLHLSIHNNDQILLVFNHDDEGFPNDTKPFTVKPTRSPRLELTNFIKLPVNPQPELINGITLIGSVNGLICSCYGDSIIHIWNPSLSAVLTLPPYSTPSRADNNQIKIHFGFGYDPKTDDYKVIKITGLTGPYIHVKWWLQVEIYSMRKGSWDLITARFSPHITTIIDGHYVCVDGHDGHLHWLAYGNINNDIDSQSQRILAFDLGSETFHEIPLPVDHIHRFNEARVLAEKLCVISTYTIEDDVYEVWVMEEYGVPESWVKHHVFSQFTGGAWPFGFTLDNEFIIEHECYVVLYDPSTNKKKLLEDYCPEEYCIDRIVEYVDSLVWVAPDEHEKVDGGQN